MMPKSIILTTLNARFIHSAFGLRYLKANLGDYGDQCEIIEYTIDSRVEDIAEQLLSRKPKYIGFGVYIWNVVQTEKLIALIKAIAPDVVVILGGPEVSYEQEEQTIIGLADYVISGWGESSFAELIDQLERGQVEQKFIVGKQPKLDQIRMPYAFYSDDDIRNRVIYVEASRGCPFKCEFCLSALDKTAWPFNLDEFLGHMDVLYQRGARHFKFVDRTFNLKVKNSLRIMEFFLERLSDDLFLHFEVVPDHLPEALKEMIQRFPKGVLQFEIGIQTFNPDVQQAISRRQDNDKAKQNLKWIREQSNAYIHADLIFGLPGESIASFADSFNTLVALRPHEVQVGILKRLKGSPIIRHTDEFSLVFNPNPPYSIVSSKEVTFSDVQRINRFARYWDMVANSGRFSHILPLLFAHYSELDRLYERFSIVSESMFRRTSQTHKISLIRLYDLLYDILVEDLDENPVQVRQAVELDYARSGLKSMPKVLQVNQGRKPLNSSSRKAYKARQSRRL